MKVRAIVICLWAACGGALLAQNDMRGHWSGSLDTPIGPMVMEFDLDRTAGGWIGSASVPAQNASGIPLDAVTFTDGKGSFQLKGGPASTTFTGTLSADGKTLDGTIALTGQSIPLKLTRTGEAKVELPKPSPAVGPQFLGKWEGTVDFGQPLRLVLAIANESDGAHATLTSIDQGNAQIAVTTITQQGTKLKLDVKAVGGDFDGDINAQGDQIKGTWTQLGMGVPLVLKKAAK